MDKHLPGELVDLIGTIGLGEEGSRSLETNDSAVKMMGDKILCQIARELADTVRRNATIDWTVMESARANIRRLVKRFLNRHGYPPDKREKATRTVLEQAELLAKDWAV